MNHDRMESDIPMDLWVWNVSPQFPVNWVLDKEMSCFKIEGKMSHLLALKPLKFFLKKIMMSVVKTFTTFSSD